MGHTREKKPVAYAEEAKKESAKIAEDFADFGEGIRVLFLVHRSKEGVLHKDRHLRSIITQSFFEWRDAIGELLEEKSRHQFSSMLRIYSSVNSRNLSKAVLTFKHEQIDAEHGPHKRDFYIDIKSRFISCLMRPANRDESFFNFDVDDGLTLDEALKVLEACEEKPQIVKQYATKNGWHIITMPFNYTKLSKPIPMQKDSLLLLKF
jgi:hypothetical protein